MPKLESTLKAFFTLLLILLIALGIFYRFAWVNWNLDANLHPDEYGLTNTLTQLSIPKSLSDYFNTRRSPLSPYPKYDLAGRALVDGPDNRMRWGQWPQIILRAAAEASGSTGYNELRLMGRALSALTDTLTLLLTFLIGRRLYGALVGLLGAALSALAVLQIQQSHFMTVDNYATLFAALAMYAAVRIAQQPPVERPPERGGYRVAWAAFGWHLLFGASLGMTLASKINLLPLAGMLLPAAFLSIADLKLRARADLPKILLAAGAFALISGLAALLTFRLAQPMSFRALTGDTTFLTLHLNPDWTESMQVAQQESSGIGGGPPSEQWSGRPTLLFPLMNMLFWGMGLPLGLAAWAGFGWAAWNMLRGRGWRAHLLPLVWAGGYFLFMATRWVMSIRYFLPVYPFLCLLAAWGLLALFERARAAKHARRRLGLAGAALLAAVVIGGTLVWANAFTAAVYRRPHTRIQATRWILENIPGPFHIELAASSAGPDGPVAAIPVAAPDGLQISPGLPYVQQFTVPADARLGSIRLPHVRSSAGAEVELVIHINGDPWGGALIDQAVVRVPPSQARRGVEARGSFQGAALQAGRTYYLNASVNTAGGSSAAADLFVFRSVIANEIWDEGLPAPFRSVNPFAEYYTGVQMPVRWTDDETKRQEYLKNLALVDTIILPSQRSIWSVSRLPRMYPMTIQYYRALFDGRLGFEQVAEFQAPYQIGPLQISDAAGALAWGRPPALPRFNFNPLAAEEAFTVYDHPPVWIFQKRADFAIEKPQAVLNSVDLTTAVFQAPRETEVRPIE